MEPSARNASNPSLERLRPYDKQKPSPNRHQKKSLKAGPILKEYQDIVLNGGDGAPDGRPGYGCTQSDEEPNGVFRRLLTCWHRLSGDFGRNSHVCAPFNGARQIISIYLAPAGR